MKTLIMDIETSPNLGYVWGIWEQNVIDVKEHWKIICFSYKWLGDKKTHVVSLGSYKDQSSDKPLVEALWKLFNESDVIIAHNGNNFDIKKTNARFIIHGLNPPSPYKTIDTLKIARKYFKFDSNKLDDLGKYFKVGKKLKTGGFDLWLGCMAGDAKSWKLMERYNKMDVILLERVYLKMLGWIDNHPNNALYSGDIDSCPNCGSNKIQRRGFTYKKTRKYQRFQCTDCGKWNQSIEAVPGVLKYSN